jgi:hypothetical protein
MPELWTPGMTGPLDQLVERIQRRAEEFKASHALDDVGVEVELHDGSLHRLASISPEPGFGFITLVPHPEDDEPHELIVPLGSVVQIRLGPLELEQRLGFVVSSG